AAHASTASDTIAWSVPRRLAIASEDREEPARGNRARSGEEELHVNRRRVIRMVFAPFLVGAARWRVERNEAAGRRQLATRSILVTPRSSRDWPRRAEPSAARARRSRCSRGSGTARASRARPRARGAGL